MLDFSFAEILLIVVVTVVFIGPKELPVVVRSLAKGMRSVKALTKEIRGAVDELTREVGLHETADEIKNEMKMIRGDDGVMYESYDAPRLNKPTPPDVRHDG